MLDRQVIMPIIRVAAACIIAASLLTIPHTASAWSGCQYDTGYACISGGSGYVDYKCTGGGCTNCKEWTGRICEFLQGHKEAGGDV